MERSAGDGVKYMAGVLDTVSYYHVVSVLSNPATRTVTQTLTQNAWYDTTKKTQSEESNKSQKASANGPNDTSRTVIFNQPNRSTE